MRWVVRRTLPAPGLACAIPTIPMLVADATLRFVTAMRVATARVWRWSWCWRARWRSWSRKSRGHVSWRWRWPRAWYSCGYRRWTLRRSQCRRCCQLRCWMWGRTFSRQPARVIQSKLRSMRHFFNASRSATARVVQTYTNWMAHAASIVTVVAIVRLTISTRMGCRRWCWHGCW